MSKVREQGRGDTPWVSPSRTSRARRSRQPALPCRGSRLESGAMAQSRSRYGLMSGGVSLARGATFFPALVSHVRHPLTVEAAQTILRRRLERRAADFLSLMRRSVFGHRGNPLGPLLRRAGCEYGDVAAMVQRDGVEGALQRLLREGVYLTIQARPMAAGPRSGARCRWPTQSCPAAHTGVAGEGTHGAGRVLAHGRYVPGDACGHCRERHPLHRRPPRRPLASRHLEFRATVHATSCGSCA